MELGQFIEYCIFSAVFTLIGALAFIFNRLESEGDDVGREIENYRNDPNWDKYRENDNE